MMSIKKTNLKSLLKNQRQITQIFEMIDATKQELK